MVSTSLNEQNKIVLHIGRMLFADICHLCFLHHSSIRNDTHTIRDLLVQQVTGRVRWRESAGAMEGIGVTNFVEFGGKVLGPMVKRSASGEVEIVSVISMDDIEALLKTL